MDCLGRNETIVDLRTLVLEFIRSAVFNCNCASILGLLHTISNPAIYYVKMYGLKQLEEHMGANQALMPLIFWNTVSNINLPYKFVKANCQSDRLYIRRNAFSCVKRQSQKMVQSNHLPRRQLPDFISKNLTQ